MGAQTVAPTLITGTRMTQEQFIEIWDQSPDLKQAELIDGVVFLPSPVSLYHAEHDALAIWWLSQYATFTPGLAAAANGTWLMLDNAPQPDSCLWIRPEAGGQSRTKGSLSAGAPELIVEVCFTSTDIDFGPKLNLYQRAGVLEYITFEAFPKRTTWRALREGSYREIQPDPKGILHSTIFPGLCLDSDAFWKQDRLRLSQLLEQRCQHPDHAAFVARLQSA
jgi:Uma2 family endonuclease